MRLARRMGIVSGAENNEYKSLGILSGKRDNVYVDYPQYISLVESGDDYGKIGCYSTLSYDYFNPHILSIAFNGNDVARRSAKGYSKVWLRLYVTESTSNYVRFSGARKLYQTYDYDQPLKPDAFAAQTASGTQVEWNRNSTVNGMMNVLGPSESLVYKTNHSTKISYSGMASESKPLYIDIDVTSLGTPKYGYVFTKNYDSVNWMKIDMSKGALLIFE